MLTYAKSIFNPFVMRTYKKTWGGVCHSKQSPANLLVTKTPHDMVVHHPSGLHECIANGRSHKAEPPPLQILAQRIRLLRLRRQPGMGLPSIPYWLAPDKPPHIGIERPKLLLHRQKRLGVINSRRHLQPIADNSRIG